VSRHHRRRPARSHDRDVRAATRLQLAYNVVVLEHNPFSPAATLAAHSLVGDWNTLEALTKLAERVDVLTLENEFVDADLLRALEKAGHTIWPDSRTLSLVQDKFIQKQTLQAAIDCAAKIIFGTTS
jgi:5-(carboxyamino)imidazole ribonucleotide synthase